MNPFPGLRSFQTEEEHLFFGRDQQTWELLGLLGDNRFLAVVGTSGSGKSSLVRAGLLPALQGGTMNRAGSSWDIMVMRPGGQPILNLARGLVESGLYDEEDPEVLSHVLATLRHNRRGLVDAARLSDLEPGTNLLLVVDQFEELFRFGIEDAGSADEAEVFVRLLLEACAQKDIPIYVVLTMRSDYLGDCARFPGLAEAVNRGEYLIPRLDRDQKKEAIEGPAKVGGGQVSPRLMQRLLNDLGHDLDQLPVLQHALMRTWDHWIAAPDKGDAMDLRDYEGTGGVGEALSRHADEVYAGLPDDRHRDVAARVFKALTERGSDNRGIRRPTRFERLCSIVDADEATVKRIVDEFRKPGVTFLMPPLDKPLEDETVIDISHESLMRVWTRLKHWVEEESQSAQIYRRLAETALLHEEGKAGLYHEPDLGIALGWRDVNRPNESWARRYHPAFEVAVRFLEESREETARQEQEKEVMRQRELEQARALTEKAEALADEQQRSARLFKRFGTAMGAVAILALVAFLFGAKARRDAEEASQRATEEAKRSDRILKDQFHEQGKAWILKAQGALDRKDYFTARMMAGRALGYQGLGREQEDAAFAEAYPILLREGSPEIQKAKALVSAAEPVGPIRFIANHRQHTDFGRALVFTDDGATLVSGGDDYAVRFWDLDTGNMTREFIDRGNNAWVMDLWFNRDQTLLLETFEGGVIKFRDMTTGEATNSWRVLPRGERIVMTTCTSDGRLMALTTTDRLRVYDLPAQTLIWERRFNDQPPRAWVDFSPDGETLVSRQENDDFLHVYEARSGKSIVSRRIGLAGKSAGLKFSPDGSLLAVAVETERGGKQLILDTSTWEILHQLDSRGVIHNAWSTDGRLLAIGEGHLVRFFDVMKARIVGEQETYLSDVGDMELSPDNSVVAVTDSSGTVGIIEVRDPTSPTHRSPLGMVSQQSFLSFSPEGNSVRAKSWAYLFDIDLDSSQIIKRQSLYGKQYLNRSVGIWPYMSSPNTLDLSRSRDGSVVAERYQDGSIEFKSPEDTSVLARWAPPGEQPERAIYSPDGLTLITIDAQADNQAVVHRWYSTGTPSDPLTMTNLLSESVLGAEIHGKQDDVALSTDGRLLAMATKGVGVLVLDFTSMQIRSFGDAAYYSVAFNPRGTLLAAGSDRGLVQFWEVESGREWGMIRSLSDYSDQRWKNNTIRANALAFSHDGSMLAIGTGGIGGFSLWDLSETSLFPHEVVLESEASPQSGFLCMAASKDRSLVAIGDDLGRIQLRFPGTNGEPKRSLLTLTQACSAIAISPDKNLLAVGLFESTAIDIETPATLMLIDLATQQTRHVVRNVFPDRIRTLAFSPDGDQVAAGSEPVTTAIKIWETDSGALTRTLDLEENETAVFDLAFSPDGRWLATATDGGDEHYLWKVGSWERIALTKGIEDKQERAVRFSADSRTLYVGIRTGAIMAWDLETRELRWVTQLPIDQTLRSNQRGVTSMDLSPDGKVLAAGMRKGNVHLVDTRSGILRRTAKIANDVLRGMAFLENGDTLLVGAEHGTLYTMPNTMTPLQLTPYLKTGIPEGREIEWLLPMRSTNLYHQVSLEAEGVANNPLIQISRNNRSQPEKSALLFERFLRAGSLEGARHHWERMPPEARRNANRRELERLTLEPLLKTLESMATVFENGNRENDAKASLQMLGLLWIYGELSKHPDLGGRADLPYFNRLIKTVTGTTNQTILVPKASPWKYLDDGSDPGTAWRQPGFDDSGWASGPAPLGYGDPVATVISYGPSENTKHPAAYFRHAFTCGNLSPGQSLVIRLRRDDGAVVYLNGHEIVRDNMPPGPILHATLAENSIGRQTESTYFSFTLNPMLLNGQTTNLLAVEMHQSSLSSSDLIFDLEASLELTPLDYLPILGEAGVKQILDRITEVLPPELRGLWNDRMHFAWQTTLPDPLPDPLASDAESWVMRSRVQFFLKHIQAATQALNRSLDLLATDTDPDAPTRLHQQHTLKIGVGPN